MKDIIRAINPQSRFENWAEEDRPVTLNPETLSVRKFQPEDLLSLADIYRRAFNSQNQRLYRGVPQARLIWDEEPWTPDSARTQLEEELSSRGSICFIAQGRNAKGRLRPVGFIAARPVTPSQLSTICASADIADRIFSALGNLPALLLWEDAAAFNVRTPEGNTIRGIGTLLYQNMASASDTLGMASIGRTSPGSYAEKILPKVGFKTCQPPVQDAKDRQRYWLIRPDEK